MSLTNLTKLLTSIVLVLALTAEVFASQGFRPWAPYQRDQFGGGARRTEGVYGTLEGVFYTFAPTKNIVVGEVEKTGGIREVYTGDAILQQTNTISTNHLGALTGFGTRAEVGRNVGHHGWSIGGYSIKDMSYTADTPQASIVINDTTRMPTQNVIGANSEYIWFFNPGTPTGFDKIMSSEFTNFVAIANGLYLAEHGPSYLWGWFITRWDDPYWEGRLAPLPLIFENARVTTKIDHWVIDALYTYRCHPTRLGNLDIFGGVRYMEVDDSLLFLGEGIPWKGVDVDPDTGELTGEAFGIGSVLGDSDWRFKADNHIIAPQIGGRWSRTNNRWTLSAEGRFLAGFNQQNLRSRGNIGSHYDNVIDSSIFPSDLPTQTMQDKGIYPWTPIGIYSGARSFNHSKTHHAFSPGVEVKINANWQLTNAVGFSFGVTGMWVDEIARGSKINDYTFYNNGQLFGLKSDGFTDSALMYGVTFGVTVNRF